jgi:hypothetical protein
LCERSLIAFENGIFQVLSLPEAPTSKRTCPRPPARSTDGDFQTLQEILKNLNH